MSDAAETPAKPAKPAKPPPVGPPRGSMVRIKRPESYWYNDVGKVVTVDQVKRMHQSISLCFWCLGFMQLQGARMSITVHVF